MGHHRYTLLAVVIGWLLLSCAAHSAAAPGEKRKAAAPAGGRAISLVSQRDPLPLAAAIDREIDKGIAAAASPFATDCTDGDFIRRATLDITGRLPTVDRVVKFLSDRAADKRQKLIDELLASSAYGEHFGGIWYDLLVVPSDDNRKVISHSFARWLSDEFNANHPWDRIVSDILTAGGTVDTNPASVFWFAHSVTAVAPNEVKVKPAEALAQASQRFLGTQIQCAECHNHPFTGYPQADFWSSAAFFGGMEVKHADKKSLKMDNKGQSPQIVEVVSKVGVIEIPDSNGKKASIKFPDGGSYQVGGENPRTAFARWCTTTAGDGFAKAAVNRMWAHFFGRGMVHPVDDLRPDNPASHPVVLAALADEFRASSFDLKHLIRCICLSHAYQRSSDLPRGQASDEALFARMQVKALSAPVLLRAISQATGRDIAPAGRKEDGGKKPGNNPKGQFLQQFSTSEEPDAAEYSHGIPQVLRLMNSGLLEAENPTITDLVTKSKQPAEVIDGLYLAALSRHPRPEELARMSEYAARSGNSSKAYRDVFWVLLNSGEFILNH